MNRWDEGSWDNDPHRHGRFTIIANRGYDSLYNSIKRTLGYSYPQTAIQYIIRWMFSTIGSVLKRMTKQKTLKNQEIRG